MPPVSRAVERKYWEGLYKCFKRLIDDIKNGSGLLNGVTQDVRKFLSSKEVDEYLTSLVSTTVHKIRIDTAQEWRQLAFKGGRGRELYELVKNEMNGPVGNRVWQIISENVAYIKSMPADWAEYVTAYSAQEAMKGKRPDEIEAELRKIMPDKITNKLNLVVRTECAKANAAIVQARAEMCGIRAYIWKAVGDERTRDAHAAMDGIVVYYDDPPSPEKLFGGRAYGRYHAGNTFNCRCWQQPIVDMRFLPNIVRVYHGGRITTMGKHAMIEKYGKVA